MRPGNPAFSRRTALAALTAGSAVVLFIARPTGGQQNLPALHAVAPATAGNGADTRVTIDFAFPAGSRFLRNPRLRITDAQGQQLELLPTYLTQGLPSGAGYRDLHTELYPPGVYQVRLEIDYVLPGGKSGTAVSAPTTLVVPAR